MAPILRRWWLANLEGYILIILLHSLVAWSCGITWKTKSFASPPPQCPWPSNLAKWLLTLQAPYYNITLPFGHVVMRDISTTEIPLATKLGRMVTNIQGLLPKVLPFLLVTWSCEITWQTKNIPTTTVSIATKLCRMATNLKGRLPVMLIYLLVN